MWSNWSWTDNIKKRVCRYLLQRYLGQYLQEKISLDQLTVDVYHGTGNVTDVTLDTTALNSLAEQQNLPIEFIDGQLGNVSVSIPWSSIMQESCDIEISGMRLTIQPKGRHENGSSMLDSMWTSMASSMQLAEECLKTTDSEEVEDDTTEENATPMRGLEHCAQTIDAILGRVRMCFNDVVVRIMLGGELQDLPLACEFHIKMCKYSGTGDEDEKGYCDSPFNEKKVQMEGVTCYIDIGGVHVPIHNQDVDSSPTLIQVGRFDGRQTFKIKLKKDNNLRGPQVSVDCNLGSFCGFVSPFQIHVLTKLMDELLHPYYAESAATRKLSEKPMDTFDFKRVEDELQEHLKPSGIGLSGLQKQYGWSFPGQDDGDEEFLPFESSKTNFLSIDTSDVMAASAISVTSSVDSTAAESLFCSSTASVLIEPGSNGHVEKLKFSITCISVSLVILERDVIKFQQGSSVVVISSVEKLRDLSCTFFGKLGLGFALADKRDIDGTCKRLHKCCSVDHIAFVATPLKLEGTQSVEVATQVTSGHASLAYFQINEFLQESNAGGPEFIQLLRFPDMDKGVEAVRIDFTNKTASSQLFSKSKIRFRVQYCHLELDLSILDRIVDILLPPLSVLGANILDSEIYHHQPHRVTGLLVQFPKLSVNIRFPIPDLTQLIDINGERPKKNVRPDSIALVMQNVVLSTLLDSSMKNVVVETKCKEVEVQYKENQSSNPMSIAVAAAYDQQIEAPSMRSQGYDWPRILFSFFTEAREEVIQDRRCDVEDDSLAGFYTAPKEPSPFSRQRTVHEGQLEDENKKGENTMPGDAAEINKFIESTCATAKYNVQVDLRCVNINLHSKDLFEQIYNRISVDLLLWEPIFLELEKTIDPVKLDEAKFRSCRPSNDFDVDEGESRSGSFFAPGAKKFQPWKKRKSEDKPGNGLSQVCLNISISEGSCSIATDADRNDFIGNEQLTAVVRNANIFIVSGYKGCNESGYVCALVKSIELYHKDPNPISFTDASTMRRIIYPSEDTVQNTFQNSGNSSELLSLAIKIDRNTTTNIKTFKVATAIKKATLFHRVALPGASWLSQLIEFFDVLDVPVAGYTPASVIVEFHLHLLECAIDYKPLYLALRSILTLDRLTISSNITAQARQSVLQILTEDAALFISNKTNSANIMEDHVCVMDMGTLEVLLRMCQSSHAPAFDLTLSINKVHIRTCSDTYKAIVELVSYFASDGDLRNFDKESVDGMSTIVNKRTSVTPDQEIILNDHDSTEKLVAEAMFDTSNDQNVPLKTKTRKYEDYEESNENCQNDILTTSAIIEQSVELYTPRLGDPIMDSCGPVDIHPSDEEDFCILENDPGVGIISKSGEPAARTLVNEPITLF